MQRAITSTAAAGVRAASTVSVSKGSASFLRTFGPIGRALRDRPNTVKASQEYFAHKPTDTYWARSSDKIFVGGTLIFTAFNTLLVIAGAFRVSLRRRQTVRDSARAVTGW